MNLIQYVPHIIIGLTVITSIIGFGNDNFRNRYIFNVGAILGKAKQWDRLITSASFHADWLHLIFNMMTLYFFAPVLMLTEGYGVWAFLGIYYGSVLGGGLLALFIHRREYYYTALGASGGVVGVLFAAIAIYPTLPLNIMFIPIDIPGWIFGIAYLAFTIYGMEKQLGNIGHDAHMGGAIVGLVMAIAICPYLLEINTLYIAAMAVPLIVLVYFVWKKK